MKAQLILTVDFAKGHTPQEVCDALDSLLQRALETAGVLDEVGDPTIDEFRVLDTNRLLELADNLDSLVDGKPDDELGEVLQPVVDLLHELAGNPDVCPTCGKPYRMFMHNCSECVDMPEVYGCPEHDDSCPFCRGEEG